MRRPIISTDHPPKMKVSTPPMIPNVIPVLIGFGMQTSLSLFADLLPEQAGWPQEQDENQNCEDPGLGPAGVEEAITEGGQQPDQDAAQHGSGNIADAAE